MRVSPRPAKHPTSMRHSPSNTVHWDFAPRRILSEPFHSATPLITSMPVLSISEYCQILTMHSPSIARHWNFSRKGIPSKPSPWSILRLASTLVPPSSELCPTLTRRLRLHVLRCKFTHRAILVGPRLCASFPSASMLDSSSRTSMT